MAGLLLTTLVGLLSLGAAQKTQLRVAFAYFSAVSDLSWTWRLNQGRIYMAGQLLDLYPSLDLQTVYAENQDDNAMPPNCPSIFETWAKAKMDIIFGTSYGFQYCMAYLAPKYPDTLWFPLLGDIRLNLTNWGLGAGNIHQTLFLAGMVAGRETRTGKVGACMPIRLPISYSHLAAFAQGVAYANASVQVITAWSNFWLGPQQDVFIVQRMVAQDVDVIWHRCGTFEGVDEAVDLGVRSIGFNANFALIAGESVLISAYYNWGPLLVKVLRLVIDGLYLANLPVDLFPGLEMDAVGLSDPSYLVRKSTMATVYPLEAAYRNGTNDTFCGPMLTNTGKVVGQAGSCLTLDDLRIMTWEPWNVVDQGHYALPSEICHPGEQSHWDEVSEKYSCSACPAGTYSLANISLTYQAYVCLPCPANAHAPRNATACTPCPSGYAATAAQDGCLPIPMATAVLVGIIVGAVLGAVFLVAAVYVGWRVWKAGADLRRLRKQFSNNNVAQECAEAIACFNLESVAWLRTCENPNKVQQSFLQILEMMTMVKPYIPDHVLSMFIQRQKKDDDAEPVSPGKDADVTVEGNAPRDAPRGSQSVIFIQAARPEQPARGSHSSASTGSRSPRNSACKHRSLDVQLRSESDWLPKRCAYMVVAVSFASAGGLKAEELDRCLPYAGQVLGEVIAIAKSFSATIDHVTYDKVALHWGLTTSVSEGALKATLASLEMGKVRGNLPNPWRGLLRLSVSVVQGFCNVATISSAGHSFFVVGGALLHQLQQLNTAALAARCECEVLVSSSVHQQVQYAVECMPRCFLDDTLFWQPVRQRATGDAHQPDEWMYELQHMEGDETGKWGSHRLYTVFHAALQGQDSQALHAQVARLREQFKVQLSPQDEACLELLLAGGGPRKA